MNTVRWIQESSRHRYPVVKHIWSGVRVKHGREAYHTIGGFFSTFRFCLRFRHFASYRRTKIELQFFYIAIGEWLRRFGRVHPSISYISIDKFDISSGSISRLNWLFFWHIAFQSVEENQKEIRGYLLFNCSSSKKKLFPKTIPLL